MVDCPIKILVVEDDHSVLLMLKMVFKHYGYTATFVDNGKEALNLLSNYYYRLLLVDWRLPDMTAINLITVTQRDFPGLKVILMSGHDYEDLRDYLGGLTIQAFLYKPFSISVLHESIQQHLTACECVANT